MKLDVKVIPNAKQSQIMGWENDRLKIKIAALPIDGKANQELVRFLAKTMKIKKTDVRIVSGENQRWKTIEVPDEIKLKIESLIKKI